MSGEYSIEILGIRMYNRNLDSFVEHVCDVVTHNKPRENRCISATGAHGIIHAKNNESFRKILNSFYANLPDGMPGVWVGRAKGEREMQRCYGPDLFAHLMQATAVTQAKHFLCGGKDGVARRLKEVCNSKFGNKNIAGIFSPPFKKIDEYDYAEIAAMINRSESDIVWIGISTPKQEKFAKYLSEFTDVHFIITVGAAFDFHIGELRQAPSWMQKSGLEWFFRLIVEPRRLFRRYFHIVPSFLFYGIKDILTYKKSTR